MILIKIRIYVNAMVILIFENIFENFDVLVKTVHDLFEGERA
jgi:hypothetical protein